MDYSMNFAEVGITTLSLIVAIEAIKYGKKKLPILTNGKNGHKVDPRLQMQKQRLINSLTLWWTGI